VLSRLPPKAAAFLRQRGQQRSEAAAAAAAAQPPAAAYAGSATAGSGGGVRPIGRGANRAADAQGRLAAAAPHSQQAAAGGGPTAERATPAATAARLRFDMDGRPAGLALAPATGVAQPDADVLRRDPLRYSQLRRKLRNWRGTIRGTVL